jgi:hypothetical protein
MDSTVIVCYSSGALNHSGMATLLLIPNSGNMLPPLPCLPATGQGQCIEEYIYQGLVALPGAAADWLFSWTQCCMSGGCNLPAPFTQGIFTTSAFNNLAAPVNNSPVFSNVPVGRFCVNAQVYFPAGATDPDGDSLVYSIPAVPLLPPFRCPAGYNPWAGSA